MKTSNIFFVNPHNGICGGNKMIFEYCNYLEKKFQKCFVVCDDAVPVWTHVDALFVDKDVAMHIARNDDIVAFHWDEDIDYVLSFPARRKFYIVQSFMHLDDSIFKLPLEFISVSNYIQRHTRSEYGVDSSLVQNFIDHTVFYPRSIKRESGRVFAIDRGGMKGVGDVKRAEKIVRRRFPDVNFVYKNNLGQLEMAEEYARSSIFVSSSWYEGFGLPPLEAMACGTAVVTTDSKGVDDFAIHGKNCIKIPPRDPRAMAEAIISLLQDEKKRASFGCEGIITARRFKGETSVDILAELFGLTLKRTAMELFSSLNYIGFITTVIDRAKKVYGDEITTRLTPLAKMRRFRGGTRALFALKALGFKEVIKEGNFDYNKVNFVNKKGDMSYVNCEDGGHILYVPDLS